MPTTATQVTPSKFLKSSHRTAAMINSWSLPANNYPSFVRRMQSKKRSFSPWKGLLDKEGRGVDVVRVLHKNTQSPASSLTLWTVFPSLKQGGNQQTWLDPGFLGLSPPIRGSKNTDLFKAWIITTESIISILRFLCAFFLRAEFISQRVWWSVDGMCVFVTVYLLVYLVSFFS